jgi:putative oxidoreductase
MIVAIGSVHWRHGLFTSKNGIELPLLFAAAAFALALTGPGLISLDAQTGLGDIWTVDLTWVVVGLGIVGGLVNLAIRRPIGTLVPGGSVAR